MPRNSISVDQPQTKGRFDDSILALLEIAREESGADGFTFYELDEARGTMALRLADETASREPGAASAVLSFPLPGETGLAGMLDFAFHNPHGCSPVHRDLLQRTAAAVATLLRKSRTPPALVRLVARLAELEAGLADLKITDRARGLAQQAERGGRSEVLLAHVASVLESCRVEQALIAQLTSLDEQLQERRLVALAKTALQKRLHITEEQAYLRIRQSSRRSRRRLSEVASALLQATAEPQEFEQVRA